MVRVVGLPCVLSATLSDNEHRKAEIPQPVAHEDMNGLVTDVMSSTAASSSVNLLWMRARFSLGCFGPND